MFDLEILFNAETSYSFHVFPDGAIPDCCSATLFHFQTGHIIIVYAILNSMAFLFTAEYPLFLIGYIG